MIQRLQLVSSSDGWFKKTLGLIIVLTGIAIMSGFDKVIETKLIDLTGTSLVEFE